MSSDTTDPVVLERVARDAGFLNFADAMARLIAENRRLAASAAALQSNYNDLHDRLYATGNAREVGWLVEKHEGGRIFYLRIDNLDQGYAWHEDSLKATRFARREDAEHAAEGGELQDLRIAEHMWVSP